MTRVTQDAQPSGSNVSAKRVDFAYNAAGQFDTITRYNNTAGTQEVLKTLHAYDGMGRLTALDHKKGSNFLAGYDYTYDAASRITSIDSLTDGLSTFTYDVTNQLTAADHNSQPDESYSFDLNGNRTMAGHTVIANNRLSTDGVYNYAYDNEGNRTSRTKISTGEQTLYEWDHRNRLTKVTQKDSMGAVVATTDNSYDVYNRWIRRTVDADGAGSGSAVDSFFAYDGTQIVLQFDGAAANDIDHRYLWGPMVDQLLTDQDVTNLSSTGSNLWPLGDHQNTLRDLATYNSGSDTTSVANHREYNGFGVLTGETTSAVDELFGFMGRAFDDSTGLGNFWHRWYEAPTGQWMSEDWITFAAGDANLRRVMGNDPVNHTDPTGLIPPEDADIGVGETYIGTLPDGTKVGTIPGRSLITAGFFYLFKWARAGASRARQSDARIGMAVARLTEKGEVEIGFLVERNVLRELTRSERAWWQQTMNVCYGKRWTTTTEVVWVTKVTREFKITEKWIATWKGTAAALLAIKIDRGATDDVLANFEATYDFIIPVGGRLSREAILDGKVTEDAVFEAIFDGFTLAAFARIAKSGKLAQLQDIEGKIANRTATKAEWKWYTEQLRWAVATNEERLLTKLEWTVIEEFGEDSVGAARKAKCKNPHLDGQTPVPGTRGTGVDRARRLEVELVQKTGKGTLDWTKKEIEYIKRTGELPPGIVGHHINSVMLWSEWAGDPRNIKFVRGQPANFLEHGRNFQNPTMGDLIDREGMLPKPRKTKK